MAASVTYQIKGKYDNKAVKSAQSDLTSLAKSMKGLGVAVWAKLSTELVKGLSKVVNGATDTFIQQNKAAKLLDETIKKSNKDFSLLVQNQSKLSRKNFFDGDTINNAERMAINMGLNQKQILSVMDAAADLAASGIMPLDQAVTELAKTYSGTTSSLGKILPQIKSLTKEELANGDAVKIVAEQYKGIADAMMDSYSGRNQQFQNNFSDLQAAVGGYVAEFKYQIQTVLNPVLNNITDWLVDNKDYVFSIIENLPELIKLTLKTAKDMLKKTFTGDTLVNIFIALGKTINGIIKNIFTYIGKLANDFIVILFTVITDVASNIPKKIGDAFGGVAISFDNALFDSLKKYAEKVFEIAEYIINPWKAVREGTTKIVTSIIAAKTKTPDANGNGTNNDDIIQGYFKDIADNTVSFTNDFKKNLDDLGTTITETYSEEMESFKSDAKKIIIKDLPNRLVETGVTSGSATGSKSQSSSSSFDLFKTDNEIANEMAGYAALDPVLGALIKFAQEFENVSALLAPVKTVFEAFLSTIKPAVNEVLAPLVGILKIIGNTLGLVLIPLLQALEPTITMIANGFSWFYNSVIVPVGNIIVTMFVGLKNMMITIINGVIDALNYIPWVDIARMEYANADDYKLATIDTSTIATAGAVSSTTSSGTSASSYTAARDIIVSINFDHSFVNGDAQEIAIMLKDEIAHAEKLGY